MSYVDPEAANWRNYAVGARIQAQAWSLRAEMEKAERPAVAAHLRMVANGLNRVADDADRVADALDADNAAQACEQGVQGVN